MDGPGLASIAAGIDFHIPQFDAEAWGQLILLIITLILCGMASAAETALTSVSRIKLKNLVEEGDEKAAEVERLLAESNTFLTTILIVNSVAVIIASSMATVLALRFSATFGELISTVLISLVVLIFCEITPKTAAVQNPLRWARAFVGPVKAVAWILHPLVWSLSTITSFFVRIIGGQMIHRGPFVTEEELRLLVTVGEEEGVLEEEETEMIHSIFGFADTRVREVMVPRIDMVTLPSTATVTQAVDVALQGGFSRIPVYEESVGIDEIIGILYNKAMLKQMREGHDDFHIRELETIDDTGDTRTFENLTFTVWATRGRRITTIRVERNHAQTPALEKPEEKPLLLPPPQTPQEQSEASHSSSDQSTQYQYKGV